MNCEGWLIFDSFNGVVTAPGYRDVGILLTLKNREGKTQSVEVRLTARDSAALLAEIRDVHRLAWLRDKPIDWNEGERLPVELIGAPEPAQEDKR